MTFLTKNVIGFVAGAAVPLAIVNYYILPADKIINEQNKAELAHLRTQIRALKWNVRLLEAWGQEHNNKA